MFDLLFKLATLSNPVVVVISEKQGVYHISISSPSSNDNKIQPVIVSGNKDELITQLPDIIKNFEAYQGFTSNLKQIAEAAEQKVKDKVSEKDSKSKITANAATTKTGKTAKANADLFSNSKLSNTEEEETVEELDTDSDTLQDDNEKQTEVLVEPNIIESPLPITKPAESNPDESEEIF